MPRFSVYRTLLSNTVKGCAKFVSRNPHLPPGDCFYVGSTAVGIGARIRAHFAEGMGGNHIIRNYGDYDSAGQALDNTVTVGYFDTREEAEAAEKRHADELRRQGYGVWTNIKERR